LQVCGQAWRQQAGFCALAHFTSQSERHPSRQICSELTASVTVHCSTQTGAQVSVHSALAEAVHSVSHEV
jgi:hypothetical protein